MGVPAEELSDHLAVLNQAQRAAASHGERGTDDRFSAGPLLVIAGAGTGKTMTLAHRVAHLIVEGVDPNRILLLTFTRRAAQEMTRRAEAIVRRTLRQEGRSTTAAGLLDWSGTFHSIANRLLRRYARNLGIDPGFSVLDRGDAADLMDVVRHELGLSAKSRRFPKKDTCLAIYSRCVNARQSLADCLQQSWPWCLDWQQDLTALYRGYVEQKQKIESLDYDDLLLYWSYLVEDDAFAAEIGAGFDHVLVDEYQDTNLLQADILNAIRPDGCGVTVVGDDAQSIYSFRAAEVRNILDFPGRFQPAARVISLEQNYRSTQPILDSANCLIGDGEEQFEKNLVSSRTGGAKPRYVTVEDGDAEAEFVVDEVLARREEGLALKQQAVLFRTSHHSDRLELELVRRNIPYVKYGGLKFLEAAHVKDLMSVLKWADNPRNRVAAFRVLKLLPGMGPATAARCFDRHAAGGFAFASLQEFAPPAACREDWPAFCELMVSIGRRETEASDWQVDLAVARRWYQPHLERIYDGVETRLGDLEQLEQISGRYPSRERFLSELTLDPPAAAGDLAGDPLLDEDYLVLSTVHSAKGQEWDHVLVLNVTDGNFPSEFATGDARLIDEERRLLYVAMTRARQSLSLLAPLRFYVTQQRRDGDRHVYGARSRFVTEKLLATMEVSRHGSPATGPAQGTRIGRKIDVAARSRGMWQDAPPAGD